MGKKLEAGVRNAKRDRRAAHDAGIDTDCQRGGSPSDLNEVTGGQFRACPCDAATDRRKVKQARRVASTRRLQISNDAVAALVLGDHVNSGFYTYCICAMVPPARSDTGLCEAGVHGSHAVAYPADLSVRQLT